MEEESLGCVRPQVSGQVSGWPVCRVCRGSRQQLVKGAMARRPPGQEAGRGLGGLLCGPAWAGMQAPCVPPPPSALPSRLAWHFPFAAACPASSASLQPLSPQLPLPPMLPPQLPNRQLARIHTPAPPACRTLPAAPLLHGPLVCRTKLLRYISICFLPIDGESEDPWNLTLTDCPWDPDSWESEGGAECKGLLKMDPGVTVRATAAPRLQYATLHMQSMCFLCCFCMTAAVPGAATAAAAAAEAAVPLHVATLLQCSCRSCSCTSLPLSVPLYVSAAARGLGPLCCLYCCERPLAPLVLPSP